MRPTVGKLTGRSLQGTRSVDVKVFIDGKEQSLEHGFRDWQEVIDEIPSLNLKEIDQLRTLIKTFK